MRPGFYVDGTNQIRTVRDGHVIVHYDSYLKAVSWGLSTLHWIYRGDAEFAAMMAQKAIHAAGKALGHHV